MKNFISNILIVSILFTGCSTVESTQEASEQQMQGISKMSRQSSVILLSELDPHNEYKSERFTDSRVPSSLIPEKRYNHFAFFHKDTKKRYTASFLGSTGGYKNKAVVVVSDSVSEVTFQGELQITAMRNKKTGEFALVLLDGNRVTEFPGGIGYAIILNGQGRAGTTDRLDKRVYNSEIRKGIDYHKVVESRAYNCNIDVVPASTNITSLFRTMINFGSLSEFRYYGEQSKKYYWMEILPERIGAFGLGNGTVLSFTYQIYSDDKQRVIIASQGTAKLMVTLDRIKSEGSLYLQDAYSGKTKFEGTYPDQKYLNLFVKRTKGTRGSIDNSTMYRKSDFGIYNRHL